MTSTASTNRPAGSQRSGAAALAAGFAALIALILVVALWRVGDGLKQQACISKVEAQFPAIPVSALNGKGTGPLKVSFLAERAAAAKDC